MRHPFFAVLGGMGTLATEAFVHDINAKTRAARDQDYLDYVVFNDASVPDRTAFLLGQADEDPFPNLAEDVCAASDLGADFIVLTCNTAHAFYDRLSAVADGPILHMPRLAVVAIERRYPEVVKRAKAEGRRVRVGFMGTDGSIRCGIYKRAITDAGYACVLPEESTQKAIMSLIYEDVKGGRPLDDSVESRFRAVLEETLALCDVAILGCTELSVLADAFNTADMPVIDAQNELVEETIRRSHASSRLSA